MLSVRRALTREDEVGSELEPGEVEAGLEEDTDYLLGTGATLDCRVFVDDVELHRGADSLVRWRPSFYAGRVAVDVVKAGQQRVRCYLDVSPNPAKSGQAEFDEMVADIRAIDQSLLAGVSSASMEFGHAGNTGGFAYDILLARLREHGPMFLTTVEAIAGSPHRSLTADAKVMPLSRIRRLHHSALRDMRLAAMATGLVKESASMDSLQLRSATSATTFDTPANRALLMLLRRFGAALTSTREKVKNLQLGSPPEEQTSRVERRLDELDRLGDQTRRLSCGTLFREVSRSETSSAGLTQIAAQPIYGRAYRLGCRAISLELGEIDATDQLHVAPSWGIYETWCYLTVLKTVAEVTGTVGSVVHARAVAAERSTVFAVDDGATLEVLFQATFPALKAVSWRSGWSLSRERRPDIVLVLNRRGVATSLVLDAKWRSGRENVLDAMSSAHLYHDALRIGRIAPSSCLLLLPGSSTVPELEADAFARAHGVGAISRFNVNASGRERLADFLRKWLAEAGTTSDSATLVPS